MISWSGRSSHPNVKEACLVLTASELRNDLVTVLATGAVDDVAAPNIQRR